MTVSTAEARSGPYTGNDVTSSFSFDFRVFSDEDIRVVETVISTAVETDLVLNTNYTVTRNVNQDENPGGSITYKVGGITTALPSTKKLTLVGNFDFEQPTDIPNGGAFFASILETSLDRVTMLIKQVKEQADRAVKVQVSGTQSPDELVESLFSAAVAADVDAAAAAASADAAATSETNAAVSAAAALAAAASIGYKDVVFVTAADSPYTATQADSGKLLSVDTSGGAFTVNLPTISGLTLPFVVGVKKSTVDSNQVTINRGGSDTFDDGTTSKSLSGTGGYTLIPDVDPAPDKWSVVAFGATTGDRKKQQFLAGSDFTAGSSTTLTLTETPIAPSADALDIFFDAANQQESEWAYNAASGVVTFTSAIPLGVSKIEAKWITPLSIGAPGDGTVSLTKFTPEVLRALAHGRCRLVFQSTSALRLGPHNGNTIIINGQVVTIPSAGVTLSNSGVSTNTLYYIYAYLSSGVLTLEYSTTGHSTDASTGVEIKTGDATRTLVGMAQTAGGSWSGNGSNTLSYFNRKEIVLWRYFGSTMTTTSTSYVALGGLPERCTWLTWADEPVKFAVNGSVSNSGSNACYTSIGVDGTTAQDVASVMGGTAGQGVAISHANSFSEGYHYSTILGRVTAGTGSWLGSSTAGERTMHQAIVMG